MKLRKRYYTTPVVGVRVGIGKMLYFLHLSLCDGQGADRRAILSL